MKLKSCNLAGSGIASLFSFNQGRHDKADLPPFSGLLIPRIVHDSLSQASKIGQLSQLRKQVSKEETECASRCQNLMESCQT
jgi:hypothetical protein